jgi:hypothetical protein
MSTQPSLARGLSLLWYPVVFAALLGALALAAYTHPQPHEVRLGIVASPAATDSLAGRLDTRFPQGFLTTPYASRAQAVDALRHQDVVAAVVSGSPAELLVASASSSIRATYLEQTLPPVLAQEGWRGPPTVTDVVPRRAQDATGNAAMFWGLPLLVVGFITSILLLQLATWSLARKAGVIAVVGALSSASVFAIATGMDVLPAKPLLLLYGFVLTQAIAWLSSGIAPLAKQYFVAVSGTFVLILGIPSAGGTVPTDLLPDVPRWLGAFMPLSQTIALGRSTAYFHDHGALRPLLILLGWAVLGAALMLGGEWRARAHRRAVHAEQARHARASAAVSEARPGATLVGTIHTTAGLPVAGATVTALSPAGPAWSGTTATDGRFELTELPFGALHVAVVAPHSEPEFSTVVVHHRHPRVRHDVVLVDWSEPVAAEAASHAV